MNLLIITVYLVVSWNVPIVFSKDGSAAEYVRRGDQYYRDFDNASALLEYRKAYDQNPKDFEALERMARIHNDIGRLMLRRNDSAEVWYSEAVVYAQQLLDTFPQRAESYFWMAMTRGSLVPFRGTKGKLDLGKEATNYARHAIEIDSSFAPAYIILGIIYREGARLKWYEHLIANTIFGGSLPGTIEESEEMFQKALALDSSSVFAYYELSRTYDQMGNDRKRIEALQQCLALIPHSLREKDQQDLAGRQLQRILENETHIDSH